jgi:hypothetical protein
MGPNERTIEFILNHVLEHGLDIDRVPLDSFERAVGPFVKGVRLEWLYGRILDEVYGIKTAIEV